MRLGIFDVPTELPLPGAAPLDLQASLRHLTAGPVGIQPAIVHDRNDAVWAHHLTAPAADLQRIISIVQNRDTYTLGDRIKKFFGCGIGARAEKYLGDYFGAETKRYLHKLNDGRFNCLLAAIVNEQNAPLLADLVHDMATMRNFDFGYTYRFRPYAIFTTALSADDIALLQRFCRGRISGNAKALKLLGHNITRAPELLPGAFTAGFVSQQINNYPAFVTSTLEAMANGLAQTREAFNELVRLHEDGHIQDMEIFSRLAPRAEALAHAATTRQEAHCFVRPLDRLLSSATLDHQRSAAATLERLVRGNNIHASMEALSRLTQNFVVGVEEAKAAVRRLVPRIIELFDRDQIPAVEREIFLGLLDQVAADAGTDRLIQDQARAAAARLQPHAPPIPGFAPVGHHPPPLPIAGDQLGRGYIGPPIGLGGRVEPRPPIIRPPVHAEPRMSGRSYEEERQILEEEKQHFERSPVNLDQLLMPAEEDHVMDAHAPREDLQGDPCLAWDNPRHLDPYNPALIPGWQPGGYAAKLQRIIQALPDAVLGDEPAATRQALLDGLVLNGRRDFSSRGCWFEKTMRTDDSLHNPESRTRTRQQIATAINFLEQLQRENRHAEVLKVLRAVDFFASACPDRACVGINVLSMQTKLLAKQRGETDPDRRALMTMKELVQQVKTTFIGATLMARHAAAGEGIEGQLLCMVMLKDVLGLSVTINGMLYRGCGIRALHLQRPEDPRGMSDEDLLRRFFPVALHNVLASLSNPKEFLAFFATPPADAQLGDQHWETISVAPYAQLADPATNEGERSRLLVNLISPILQGLGFIKTDPPSQLIERAGRGDAEAIKILYWHTLDHADDIDALMALQTAPVSEATPTDILGILAKKETARQK